MNDLLSFLKLLNQFRAVERKIYISSARERSENDVEHSYQLALLAWHVINHKKLTLDINKVLQFALLHDFVEVHAGDTFVYDKNQEVLDSKHEREKEALEKLKREWPENSSLWGIIAEYEKRQSPESIYVYVLDKLLPFLNVLLNKGTEWKDFDITLDMIKKSKESQMILSKDIEPYYRQLIEFLEKNQKQYFNN